MKTEKSNVLRQQRAERALFKLTPVAAFVAAVSLAIANPTYAADARSAEEIQAEVTRLKQLLEQEEQALHTKTTTQSTPTSPVNKAL